MPVSYAYNTAQGALTDIYTASGGGTVFSANLYNTAAFNYFTDTAVVNDAIYFAKTSYADISDLTFNVGTAFAASSYTLVWEYYRRTVGWVPIVDLLDDTAGFTILGLNRVRFPLQWECAPVTINGLSRAWFRCRISAVSGITEGGANVTDTIKKSDGQVIVSGGTDAVPATYDGLYTWMTATYPYVVLGRRCDKSFDFTKISIDHASILYSTCEVIEIGQNLLSGLVSGETKIKYLKSGIRVGDNGYRGSTFNVYGGPNMNVVTNNSGNDCKCYGTVWRSGKYGGDQGQYAGYCALNGEWIDGRVELAITLPAAGAVVKGIRQVSALIIAGSAIGEYSNIFDFITGQYLFYLYTVGWTMKNFGYKFLLALASLSWIYQASGRNSQEWILIDPSIPLNSLADDIKPVTFNSSIVDIGYYKIYDASLGTYTTYTTEANNPNINDTPLTGDVGDILYFGFGSASLWNAANGAAFIVTKSTTVNDYVYSWEWYGFLTGASPTVGWHPCEPNFFWDSTNNLSNSGIIAIAPQSMANTVTIDGVNTSWVRATIISTGSGGAHNADSIKRWRCGAISNWSLMEKYSVNVKVVDENGDPINGATVAVFDSLGAQIFLVTTAADGTITEQLVNPKEWHFDPSVATYYIKETIDPVFSLSVSKIGYETYMTVLPEYEKTDIVLELKTVNKIRKDIEGGLHLAISAEKGSDAKTIQI